MNARDMNKNIVNTNLKSNLDEFVSENIQRTVHLHILISTNLDVHMLTRNTKKEKMKNSMAIVFFLPNHSMIRNVINRPARSQF